MMDGQFHPDTKVFFARQRERACLHTSSQRAHTLPQTSESQTGTSCAFHLFSLASIVQHLSHDGTVLFGHMNATLPCATVAADLRHPFPYRPRKGRGETRGEDLFEGPDLS